MIAMQAVIQLTSSRGLWPKAPEGMDCEVSDRLTQGPLAIHNRDTVIYTLPECGFATIAKTFLSVLAAREALKHHGCFWNIFIIDGWLGRRQRTGNWWLSIADRYSFCPVDRQHPRRALMSAMNAGLERASVTYTTC